MKKFIIELKECIPNRLFDYLKKMNPKCKRCNTDPQGNSCVCDGTCNDYRKCDTEFKAEQRKKNKEETLCPHPTDNDKRKRRFLRCLDCNRKCNCKNCPYFKVCQEMYKNEKRPPKPKQPKHPFPWSRIPKDKTPTAEQTDALILAFDHFNKELFAGALIRPMLTLSRNPITKLGYFSPLKWYNPKGEHAHELGLNANLFFTHDIVLFYTCFIHEMIHIYQYDIEKNPGQPGEHNQGYIEYCKFIGLKTIPQPGDNLHTELIEGKRAYKAILTLPKACTFPYMSYPSTPDGTPIPVPVPMPGGAGQPQPGQAGETAGEPIPGEYIPGETMPDGTPRPRSEPPPKGETKAVNIPMTGKRAKYTCPKCGLNAWARPGVSLYCSDTSRLVEVKS